MEDYLDTLEWAKSVGGLKGLQARANANAKVIADWVKRTDWIDFLARDPALRSNTSVCLKVVDAAVSRLTADAQAAFVKAIAAALENEGVAYDIASYRDAPPRGCAHLVRLDGRDSTDVEALTLVARLGLCQGQGRVAESGVETVIRFRSPADGRNQ